MRTACVTAFLVAASLPAQAHEFLSFDELMEAFNTDLETASVRSAAFGDGLHALFGAGGNVVVSIGDQGVLMVDSQYAQMVPRLEAEITRLGGGAVDFTINTHWHFDHADGNPVLGRKGTWMIAHENSRRMMTGEREVRYVDTAYLQPAYPMAALPVFTYDDRMRIHFNGESIELLHFGPAHTSGDTAVWFRDGNVLHMGDIFFARYPYIDAGNGGDVEGVAAFCREILNIIDPDTRIVPGHGPLLDYDDLVNYTEMIETVADRVTAMISDGMSLEEILASGPTADFDQKYGNPTLFLVMAYESLSR